MFYFYWQKQFCEQFYASLIFYGYVKHHHMGLAISLQPNSFWRIARTLPVSEENVL